MRRNFILLVVATIFLSVFMSVNAQTELLNETFASCSYGEIPVGWDNSDGTESIGYYKWSVQSRNLSVPAYDGNYVTFNSCYSYTGNTNCLKTPSVTLTGYYRLKFVFANPTGGDFSVYLSTDGGVTYPVLLESGLTASSWTEKQYDLSAYKDSTVTIVFKSTSNYGAGGYATSYHYLDNVVIDPIPTCRRPIDIAATNITTTSADLSWGLDQYGDEPSSYKFTVTDNTTGAVIVNETALVAPYHIASVTNLSSGTTYAVSLQGDCSAAYKGLSEYSPLFTFTTLCDAVSLPLSENFDAESSLPDCWVNSPDYPDGVSVSSNYFYGYSGKSLCLTPSSSHSVYVTTPMIDAAYDNIELDFYIRPLTSMETQYQVGVMLNPYDFTSFYPIVTNTTNSEEWKNVRVNTASLASELSLEEGQRICFAFKTESNAGTQSFFIDNVDIHTIPTCPRIENVAVSDVDSMSCNVSWTYDNAAVAYQMKAVNVATNQAVYQMSQANQSVFAGLSSGTRYDISVRAICAVGDTSEWSLPVSMMTGCGTYVTPIFSESFENGLPDCWEVTATTGSYYKWNVTTPYYPSTCADGTKCVNLSSNYGTIFYSALISKPVRIDVAGKYDAYFYIYRYNGSNPINDELVKIWAGSTPDTTGAVLLGAVNPNINVAPTELTDGWYKYSFNIPVAGLNYIIVTGGTYPSQSVYIDNVGVEIAPACRWVTDIRVEGVTENSAGLTWNGSADSYVVSYTASSSKNSVSGNAVVNNSYYNITGLLPGTTYNISGDIYAKCGGDSSVIKTFALKVTTNCEAVSTFPYLATFEESQFPANCWSAEGYGDLVSGSYGGATQTGWERSTKQPYKGEASAYMKYSLYANPYDYTTEYYHNKANMVLPQFAFAANTDYQVSWYQYRQESSANVDYEYVSVYVNDTPDTVNATLLKTVYNAISKSPAEEKAGYYMYTADFTNTLAGNKYIIFNAHNYGHTEIFIDNIRVYERPSCASIFNFDVDSTSSNSVRINMNDEGITSWQIGYGIKGVSTDNLTVVDATSASFVLTGLDADTRYDIYVRNDCGGDYSLWSDEYITVHTYCEPMAVTLDNPFIENFETGYSDNDIVDNCFIYGNDVQFTVASQYNYQSYPYYTINPYEGGKFAYFSKYHGELTAYYPVTLQAGANYYTSVHVTGCYGTIPDGARLFISSQPDMDKAHRVADVDSADVAAGRWSQMKGYFTVGQTGTYYLGIYLDSYPYYGGVSAMDNLKLMQKNCIPPTDVEAAVITSNSAELVITSNATQWQVRLLDNVFNPETDTNAAFIYDTIVNDRTVLLGSLAPNTTYYYAVRSIIPATGELSEWTGVYSFTTSCAAFAVPFAEDFESEKNMNCWVAIGDGKNYFKPNTTYHYSGYKSATLYNSLVVSPEMDVPAIVNNYMLSGFAFIPDVDSCNISLGLMTDPNDIGTLTDIETVTIKGMGKWTEFSVILSFDEDSEDFEYVETARYFTISSNMANAAVYLDKIELTPIPTCIKPTDLACTGVTDTSAVFAWTSHGNESSWHVIVKDVNDNVVVDKVVSTNPVTIGGLSAATEYKVSVAAICSANDTSRYAELSSFSTVCAPLTLPYSYGFEVSNPHNDVYEELESDCVTGYQYPDPYTTSYAPEICYYDNTEGVYSLKFKSHKSAKTYIVLPKVNADANTCKMLLDYRMENADYSGDLVVGVITNPFDANTFVPVVTLEKCTTIVKNREIDFSVVDAGYADAHIAICSGVNSVEGFATYIDNIRVESLGNCPAPALMRTDIVTENSAVISFRALGNQWQYIVGELGFDTLSVTPVAVSDTLFALTDLQSATMYQVYMRNVCGSGYSAWSEPFVFNTLCESVINAPYKQTFDFVSTPEQACIDIFSTTVVDGYPYAGISSESGFNVSGSSLMTYASTASPVYIALPQLNIPLNSTYVEFSYRNESVYADIYPEAIIGYMTDINDESSFVECSRLPLQYVMTKAIYAFDTIAATTGRVVIKVNAAPRYDGSKTAFDNIVLGKSDTCKTVENVALVNVTDNSASFSFDYYPLFDGVDSFECSVLDNAGTVVVRDTIGGKLFVAENLEPQTEYTLLITAFCGNGSSSSPVRYAFRTNSLPIVPPFTDDFDTDSGKWTFVNGSQSCRFVIGSLATTTGNSLYIYNTESKDYSYNAAATVYAYTALQLEEGTYEFNYKWKANGQSNYDYARVFLAPNGTALTAGTAVLSCYQSASQNGYIALDGGDQSQLSLNYNWQNERVIVDIPATQTYKFVVMWTNDDRYANQPPLAFDDFSVTKLECPVLPKQPEVLSVSHDSAAVALGNSIRATVEYRLCRSNNATDSICSYTTLNDTVVFGGLLQNTTYYVCLRTVCDEAVSSWTTLEFTTLKSPAVVPYITDFSDDDDNNHWLMDNNTSNGNRFFIGAATDAVYDGGRALYVSNNGTDFTYATNVISNAYASRRITFDAGSYLIRYKYKVIGEGKYDFARAFLAPDGVALGVKEPAVGINSLPAGCIALDNGAGMSGVAEWQDMTVTLDVETPITYNMCFYWVNDGFGSGNDSPLAVDNISITPLTCRAPEISSVVDDVKAVFSISGVDDNANIIYTVRKADDNSVIANDTISNREFTVTGLASVTSYVLECYADCGGGDNSLTTTVRFTTRKAATRIPYVTGFEDDTDNDKWLFVTENRNSSNNCFRIGGATRGVHAGSKGLYVGNNTDDYGYTTKWGKTTYAYRPIRLEPGQYHYSYSWTATSASPTTDFGRFFIIPDTVDLNCDRTILSKSGAVHSEAMAMDGDNLAVAAGWVTNEGYFLIDKAGTYNIVAQWTNRHYFAISGSDSNFVSGYPVAFDDLTIDTISCMLPVGASVIKVENNYAEIDLNNANAMNIELSLSTTANPSNVVILDTVNGNTYTLNNLAASTNYILYMRTLCSETETSPYTSLSFRTYCNDIVSVTAQSPYIESFETMAGNGASAEQNCWTEVKGTNAAGWLVHNAGSYSGITAPNAFDGSNYLLLAGASTSQLSRPVRLESGVKYEFSSMVRMDKKLPSDADAASYEYSVVKDNEQLSFARHIVNTDSYVELVDEFSVTESGIYNIGIKATVGAVSEWLAVDYLTVSRINVSRPANLAISNITSSGADISWNAADGADKYRVNIRNSKYNTDIDLFTTQTSVTVSALNPNNLYDVRLYAIDSATGDTSNCVTTSFRTACGESTFPFVEDFNDYAQSLAAPSCWILSGSSNNLSSNWHIGAGLNAADGNSLVMSNNVLGTAQVMSPEFTTGDESYLVRFKYRQNMPARDSLSFRVYEVVDDGSYQLLQQEVLDVKGDNLTDKYVVVNHPNKKIRLAFTAVIPVNKDGYIYVDDIYVNCYAGEEVIAASVCRGDRYVGNGFVVEPAMTTDASVTAVNMSRIILGSDGGCDSIVTLNLAVNDAPVVHIFDTICNGDIYSRYGFDNLDRAGEYNVVHYATVGCDTTVTLHLEVLDLHAAITRTVCEGDIVDFAGEALSQSGEYSDTLTGRNGCDSVVTLFLNVIPREVHYNAYICEGGTYTWNGVTYSNAAVDTVRFTNSLNCDSLEILHLSVIPSVTRQEITLCEGQTYNFYGSVISESGEYSHILRNSLDCDSTIILDVTVTPAPVGRYSDYVCEGDGYSSYGFVIDRITQDTLLTRRVNSVDGCDSVVEVSLTFVPVAVTDIEVTINDGETYEFGGNTLNQAGEYTHTFYSSLGCDSIVNLTLNVVTSVDDSYMLPIVIAPNPVLGGQSTFVIREWTEAEKNAMRVEVLDAIGQVVETFTPATFPVEIGGIYTSGVYYIRITAGTGEVYFGRLVVR